MTGPDPGHVPVVSSARLLNRVSLPPCLPAPGVWRVSPAPGAWRVPRRLACLPQRVSPPALACLPSRRLRPASPAICRASPAVRRASPAGEPGSVRMYPCNIRPVVPSGPESHSAATLPQCKLAAPGNILRPPGGERRAPGEKRAAEIWTDAGRLFSGHLCFIASALGTLLDAGRRGWTRRHGKTRLDAAKRG